MKKCVSAILINENRELLFHLRDDKESISFPNYWSFLGGSVEKGETLLRALQREIKEEIGYQIKNPVFIAVLDDKIGHLTYMYKAGIDKKINEIHLTEGQKVEYLTYEEGIKNLRIPEVLKDFMIKYKDRILSKE